MLCWPCGNLPCPSSPFVELWCSLIVHSETQERGESAFHPLVSILPYSDTIYSSIVLLDWQTCMDAFVTCLFHYEYVSLNLQLHHQIRRCIWYLKQNFSIHHSLTLRRATFEPSMVAIGGTMSPLEISGLVSPQIWTSNRPLWGMMIARRSGLQT